MGVAKTSTACNLCNGKLPPKCHRKGWYRGRRYYVPTCEACRGVLERASAARAQDRMMAELPPAARAEREARIAEYQKRAAARVPVTGTRQLTHGR